MRRPTPRELVDVTANAAPLHKFLHLFRKTGQNARCLTAVPTTSRVPFPANCRCRGLIYLANPIDVAEAWDNSQIFVAAPPLATYTRCNLRAVILERIRDRWTLRATYLRVRGACRVIGAGQKFSQERPSERDRAVASEGGFVNKCRSRRKSPSHPRKQGTHALSSVPAIACTVRPAFPILPPAQSLLRSSPRILPAECSSDLRFESHLRLPDDRLAAGL